MLGTTAGSPGIVFEAIRSGNIMDPAHMLRAEKMKEDWEKGPGVFAPYLERQRRVDQEQEQLRLLGEKMGGPLKELGYKAIRELIGDVPVPIHLILAGGMRARGLKPQHLDAIKEAVYSQDGQHLITKPFSALYVNGKKV